MPFGACLICCLGMKCHCQFYLISMQQQLFVLGLEALFITYLWIITLVIQLMKGYYSGMLQVFGWLKVVVSLTLFVLQSITFIKFQIYIGKYIFILREREIIFVYCCTVYGLFLHKPYNNTHITRLKNIVLLCFFYLQYIVTLKYV